MRDIPPKSKRFSCFGVRSPGVVSLRDMSEPFFYLDPSHVDSARLRRERDKARELRRTQWWRGLVSRGECHYCGARIPAGELTMDHVVPLARGGRSTRGNLVPSCQKCNASKKLETPVEQLLRTASPSPGLTDSGSDH